MKHHPSVSPIIPRRRMAIGCILASFSLSFLVATASAQNLWTGTTSTEWNLASNWSLGTIPVTAEATQIDIGSGNMPVISTADAATGALVVGNWRAPSGGTATLTVQNGRKLNVSVGTTVNLSGTKNGLITVTGSGSELNMLGTLTLGSATGLGTLDILNQGRVTNAAATLGTAATATGVLNISGSSSWAATNITIGVSGTGSVTISGGSTVTLAPTSGPTLGKTGNGTGSLLVTGVGSSVTSSHFTMYVGSDNLSAAGTQKGYLTIADGGNVKLNGVSANGYLELANKAGSTGVLTIGSGAGAGTLSANRVIGGSGTASVVFNHNESSYTFVPLLTGSLKVEQSGVGTTVLSTSNDYTGGTTVTLGTLLANHATNSLGSGVISVTGSSAVLGGTGRIANGSSSFSVDGGGTLLAGNGSSETTTLTIAGNLTLGADSVIRIVLGGALESSTLARASGTWVFDSDQAFVFTLLGGATAGTYENIITGLAADPWGGGPSPWTIVNPGLVGQFQYDGANVDFVVSTIPEPNVGLLVGFGLVLLLGGLRRRSSMRRTEQLIHQLSTVPGSVSEG